MSRASGKPNGVFHEKERHDGEGEGKMEERNNFSKYTKKLSTHLLMVAIYFQANFPGIG